MDTFCNCSLPALSCLNVSSGIWPFDCTHILDSDGRSTHAHVRVGNPPFTTWTCRKWNVPEPFIICLPLTDPHTHTLTHTLMELPWRSHWELNHVHCVAKGHFVEGNKPPALRWADNAVYLLSHSFSTTTIYRDTYPDLWHSAGKYWAPLR